MPTIWKNLLLFLSLFAVSACGIYRQNVVNVPFIQQKGEAQLSGHASFSGLDGQASYAITNHIAVMANYSHLGEDKETYSASNYELNKHHFGEMGIGYFKKTRNGNFADYFFLAGQGKTSHFVQSGNASGQIRSNNREVHYNRYCFQSDFGWRSNKLEYALSPRLMVVDYFNITDSFNNNYKDGSNAFLYADLSNTLRYSVWRFLKLSGQLNCTLPFTKTSYFDFAPFNCSIGLILNLNFIKQPVPAISE